MAKPKLEDRPSTINRSERPKRNPINGHRDVLNVQGQEEGYHYCWVNEDKVPRYEQAWYEFVTHDVVVGDRKVNAASQLGGKVSMSVGNNLTAYLMRVPQEYYDEDRAAEQADLDEKETSMRSSLNSGGDGRYGGVDISQNKPLARG